MLLDGWVGDGIDLDDEASVALVREAVRAEASAAGLSEERREALAAAASELGHNQLRHGRAGRTVVRRVMRGEVAGVEVVAGDRGAGIADPAAALRGEPRSSGSAGVGLSAAYRLCDEMDFDVRLGEGTCIWARCFASPVARSEVAVFGRPISSEPASGDQALFSRDHETLLLAVIDGLGHGPPARVAADAAVEVARRTGRDPEAILRAVDGGISQTRGAVMAVARWDLAGRALACAGVGNIGVLLATAGSSQRFPSANGVLGARPSVSRIPVEGAALDARATLLLFSDGLSSRLGAAGEEWPIGEPPIVTAQRLLERYGRDHDDALILVAR
jgi:anti-sigma regulatory factor (Ser/Thr protein kinase)